MPHKTTWFKNCKWEAVVREWSFRWGREVWGWWIDGCYFADEMYRNPRPPNFKSFAEALTAGNPDALVAFNPGQKFPMVPHSEHEDRHQRHVLPGLHLRRKNGQQHLTIVSASDTVLS